MIELKSHEILLPSDKSFGVFASIVALIIGLYFYYVGNLYASSISVGVSVLVILTVLTKPSVLRPLNFGWLYLGLFLGAVISPLVLGSIYFLIITPVAVILRISGRDELRLKLKSSDSDWKARDEFIIDFDKQY
ncbi:SxtJ family membrane protein [Pseudomonas sp. HK3]